MPAKKKFGFDEATCIQVAEQVKKVVDAGVEVAIVIGGGNYWRGRSSETIDRPKADQIGMLATVMNCIYVSEIFRYVGMQTSIYTPFTCGTMSELFAKDKAVEDLKNGKVVFLAGGIGHPYFSTDTTTALRSIELECDVILMARAVDGVYDSDPKKNPNAVKYDCVSYKKLIDDDLKVFDHTASILCRENKMPSLIFALEEENAIYNNCFGNQTGTLVTVD